MKFGLIHLLIAFIALLSTGSCTMQSAVSNKKTVKTSPLDRDDYIITKDMTDEGEVKSILFGLFYTNNTNGNYKEGYYGKDQSYFNAAYKKRAEDLAMYNLLKKNPEIDYLTNVRFITESQNYLFYKKASVKVIAKGIILKSNR